MTTPKEALTYISNARWDENADLDDICTMADRALVSFEGDAVEKVARIIDPHSFMDIPFTDDHVLLDMVEQSKNDALHKARRILATGLVPDEAAIRADQRPLGDLFNELVRRMNFDGMDPRTFTLDELERAIDGAGFPK